jgi:hypothetical protein
VQPLTSTVSNLPIYLLFLEPDTCTYCTTESFESRGNVICHQSKLKTRFHRVLEFRHWSNLPPEPTSQDAEPGWGVTPPPLYNKCGGGVNPGLNPGFCVLRSGPCIIPCHRLTLCKTFSPADKGLLLDWFLFLFYLLFKSFIFKACNNCTFGPAHCDEPLYKTQNRRL